MFINKGAVALVLLSGALLVSADEVKPCFIFSGAAGENYAIDLERYNRISFGDDAMELSSSEHSSARIQLLYSAYNRFRIAEGKPSAAVEEVEDTAIQLYYNATTQELILAGDSTEPYTVGVFNLSGMLMYSGNLRNGEPISLSHLGNGVYVAVAVTSTDNHTIKFVK